MDICEVCNQEETKCDCVYCRACGYKTPRDDMYGGKCGACEDNKFYIHGHFPYFSCV